MSHDRSQTIPLPAEEPRCEPSGICHVRANCARYQAAIPKHGASIADYSVTVAGGTALCDGYVDSRTLRKAAMPPVPAKPYVRGL